MICPLQPSVQNNWLGDGLQTPFLKHSANTTKLVIFQFQLLHRRITTNDFLNKIGIRENDICTFWRTEKESLFHSFWSCSDTFCFWQGFMKWLAENQIKLNSDIFTPDIIFGWRRTPYPTQSNTFTSFLPNIKYGSAKQRKYFQK